MKCTRCGRKDATPYLLAMHNADYANHEGGRVKAVKLTLCPGCVEYVGADIECYVRDLEGAVDDETGDPSEEMKKEIHTLRINET